MIYSPTTGKKMAEFVNGELVWSSAEFSGPAAPSAPMVMGDIAPYQSQIDGSMITSRSQHRSHLRQHGCIEIGNETKFLTGRPAPAAAPPGLRQEIAERVYQKLRY